ncbi:MAG: helix-turn-helix transcriptional regulator [Clostridiales bacterium]|nr:helix-turn-helix transcriptional regulator [Clostridiales bacterium]
MGLLELIRRIAKGEDAANQPEPPPDQAEPAARNPAPDPAPLAALEEGPPAAQERLGRLETLTPREREVCAHLLRGRKMREIAEQLGVTYATVNFHCKGLYKKLGINTRAQLFVQYAMLDRDRAETARPPKDGL